MIENVTDKKKRKRGAGYLTPHERNLAYKKLSDQTSKLIFNFILHTGLRVSELITIQTKNIDDGFFEVRGKRKVIRKVYFQVFLIEQAKEYLLTRKLNKNQNPELLFPYSRITVYNFLKPANVYPHLLRHTFLTDKLRDTKNLKLVQSLAGHKNINTTAMYLHFTSEEIKNAYTASTSMKSKFYNFFYKSKNVFQFKKNTVPERKITPDKTHKRFVIFGEKGVGKTHIIQNSFKDFETVDWESKGQTTKALNVIQNQKQHIKNIHINFGNPAPTKFLYAENLNHFEIFIAEFRIRNATDEKNISKNLFEFQPFKIENMNLSQAKNYLKFLCRISNANYNKVKNLIDISTNPLFLKENLFRKRKEILMSSPALTLGPLFIILGIVFMLSRYVAMGRETYFLAMGGYFVMRLLARF